jgi:hypothetical protein
MPQGERFVRRTQHGSNTPPLANRRWRESEIMDMNVDMEQTAEIQDALGACDELHAVLARLKRLGLLTEDEDQETRDSIETITETLTKKLPDDAE